MEWANTCWCHSETILENYERILQVAHCKSGLLFSGAGVGWQRLQGLEGEAYHTSPFAARHQRGRRTWFTHQSHHRWRRSVSLLYFSLKNIHSYLLFWSVMQWSVATQLIKNGCFLFCVFVFNGYVIVISFKQWQTHTHHALLFLFRTPGVIPHIHKSLIGKKGQQKTA